MNMPLPDDEVLREVLDHDLSRSDLARLAEINQQLQEDEQLSAHLDDLLRIRAALSMDEDSADRAVDGVLSVQQRLTESIQRPSTKSGRMSKAVIGRLGAGFVGGLAAAAVLMLSIWGAGVWDAPVHPAQNGTGSVVDTSMWLPASPREQQDMLTQLAVFYDGRAGWLAITGPDIRMGLADHPVDTSEPIVTRLSLEAPDGSTINTDLVLVPGLDVTIEAPRPDGTPVRYSIKAQPAKDGYRATMLDLTVSIDNGPSMSTEIPLAGDAVREVGRLLTDQGQYQLRLGLASST